MQPESSDDQGADPRPAEPKKVGVGAEAYDDQWARRAAAGESVHGEADLIERLLRGVDHVPRVLDAGCGTGRVAIRLAERGVGACGVDVDDALLERARTKAPTIPWHRGDLATLRADEVPGPFDAIVLAGNVMIFVAPGTEGAVLHNLASRLAPGGLLVAGFQLRDGGLTPDGYDEFTRAAGLAPHARAATWDGDPFTGGDYLVAIDQLTNRR